MTLRLLLAAGLVAWAAGPALAQSAPVSVGRLSDGARVSLTPSAAGYGLEVSEKSQSRLMRAAPVRLEFFHSESDIRTIDIAYRSATKEGADVVAIAETHDGGSVIHIEDRYSVAGAVLAVSRSVRVEGESPGTGFLSGLMLSVPAAHFDAVSYFAPAVLYRGPGQNNQRGPSGSAAFAEKNFAIREDALPAPMLGLSFADQSSVTLLDVAPTGETTEEDTRATRPTVLIDRRFGFGAFGSHEDKNGDLEFGYWFPGGVIDPKAAGGQMRRRYHPLSNGMTQHYRLALRFGQKESFPEFDRNAWRWAFDVLKPQLTTLDVDMVRRVLLDHLADRVTTIGGRTGIPWIFQVTDGQTWHRPDDMRAAMGFVGKNIEAADLLLMEGDRDPGPRGQRMRRLGLAIIDTFIKNLPMNPPAGEAIDLPTGAPTVSFPPSSWRGNANAGARLFIRAPTEDMRKLVAAYQREKGLGRDHPEWLAWARQFADWLLPQQRPDGSFPRAWRQGTSEVVEPSGNSSYAPVPFLAVLSQTLGNDGKAYRDAALRAADYVWTTQGQNGVFTGGTLDNPNVVDKEAGMLSLEAFLSAYDLSGDRKWLARAQTAADFTESWMYLWNVPMADDAIASELHWKPGVPTTGVGIIAIGNQGGVDQFLDWSAPAYARLYQLTGNAHYFDVARILLLDTKSMLALPGRTFDMAGPGWQQENYSLSGRRGFGAHRGWLPWVSVNHLWSIVGIEMLDKNLFARMAAAPR